MEIQAVSAQSKQDFRHFVRNDLAKKQKSCVSYRHIVFVRYLKYVIQSKQFKNILLFYPMAFEPNILPLLSCFKKSKNKRIFLPSIEGLNFKMLPYRLPLQQNQYKIWEPKPSHFYFQKIDLAIIPCLGIDLAFRRIGMGKGMYDRTFGMMTHKIRHKMYKIFVNQDIYLASCVMTQDFDINANEYISYKFRVKKGFKNDSTYNSLSSFWVGSRLKRLSCLQKNSKS
ncbi:5-formyltetrahydrofolate cyclo-ligase [Helicobacter fennelliae]|uniref:5-formyltetrahydrofolate cyclo-ligase n=1 Tax=Helicobacter fennelliae TaxID=215 RepID=UPI0006891CB1|nr:5-formyltetrahydrofolate cyclo-ligase [Helicobacter fennelliae]